VMALSIKIGEQTGNLGKALERLHRYYTRRSSEKVAVALQFLEPAMTVSLGVFLGSVAVSLFYPLVNLAMNLK